MELALKHAAAEKKLEKEAYLKAQKENEKESRNVKKLELQLKACQDSLTNVTLAYEKVLEKVIKRDSICVIQLRKLIKLFPSSEKSSASNRRNVSDRETQSTNKRSRTTKQRSKQAVCVDKHTKSGSGNTNRNRGAFIV